MCGEFMQCIIYILIFKEIISIAHPSYENVGSHTNITLPTARKNVIILKDNNALNIFEKLKLEKQHKFGNATTPTKAFSIVKQLKKDNWELQTENVIHHQQEDGVHQHHHKLPLNIFDIPHIWQNVHIKTEKEPIKTNNDVQVISSIRKVKKKKKIKKKKKRKRKKKRKPKQKQKQKKKRKKPKPQQLQTAQVLFATAVTTKPHHHYHYPTTTTTTPPSTKPSKNIKYVWYKSNAIEKKKKEYLNHLSHVIYPFVKFVVFFTVINPFTLGVFLFSLISPVVFGFLGFMALSVLIKPGLKLLFDVKHRVTAINRKKSRERRKQQLLWTNRRPITIHKHYYKYQPIHQQRKTVRYHHNPILPQLKHKFDNDLY